MFSLSACGMSLPETGTARQQNFLLDDPAPDAFWQETQLTKDVIALEDSIRAMTINARTGTDTAKCSALELSDPGMADCSEAQLKSGWMGQLASAKFGSGPVATDKIAPEIASIFEKLDAVDDGIDQMLIAQRREILRLQDDLAKGTISQGAYTARMAEMRDNRRVIAETLDLSVDRAAKARRVIEKAASNGQPGLSWYISSIERIEQMATTHRSQLILLDRENRA